MFGGLKEACAAADRLTSRLDMPRARALDEDHVQAQRDEDWEQKAILARTALRSAGIDPDGEDARMLYAWAGQTDEKPSEIYAQRLDGLIKLGVDAEAAADRIESETRRLEGLIKDAHAALVKLGLLRGRARLKIDPVPGYQVLEDEDGRRSLQMVHDTSQADYKADQLQLARSVIAGAMVGPVRKTSVAGEGVPFDAKHPKIMGELLPKWRRGEFEVLGELDDAVARALGCTDRHARRVRESWGVRGLRSRTPTRPEVRHDTPAEGGGQGTEQRPYSGSYGPFEPIGTKPLDGEKKDMQTPNIRGTGAPGA